MPSPNANDEASCFDSPATDSTLVERWGYFWLAIVVVAAGFTDFALSTIVGRPLHGGARLALVGSILIEYLVLRFLFVRALRRWPTCRGLALAGIDYVALVLAAGVANPLHALRIVARVEELAPGLTWQGPVGVALLCLAYVAFVIVGTFAIRDHHVIWTGITNVTRLTACAVRTTTGAFVRAWWLVVDTYDWIDEKTRPGERLAILTDRLPDWSFADNRVVRGVRRTVRGALGYAREAFFLGAAMAAIVGALLLHQWMQDPEAEFGATRVSTTIGADNAPSTERASLRPTLEAPVLSAACPECHGTGSQQTACPECGGTRVARCNHRAEHGRDGYVRYVTECADGRQVCRHRTALAGPADPPLGEDVGACDHCQGEGATVCASCEGLGTLAETCRRCGGSGVLKGTTSAVSSSGGEVADPAGASR